jgi:hypothetical protein
MPLVEEKEAREPSRPFSCFQPPNNLKNSLETPLYEQYEQYEQRRYLKNRHTGEGIQPHLYPSHLLSLADPQVWGRAFPVGFGIELVEQALL